ncbi:hypothetical protein FisN_11Lh019 [Fistulifera solaris]|uniref:Uncharacterized protein n=1 Tax=Fistulifera solaris TaxID=1519565 RepID=A0A1Z5J845_FISSO|nr:hypothetical protein FisN_11Lh019 [Fistulifera solaris]|eukprot:GAX09988.1 hypothetical protein FisN_11Lh019 [Fistulifera solaris]
MKALELPPILSAALPGIRWPLEMEAPPLHFRSLDEMKQIRSGKLPDLELFRDVPGSLDSFFPLHEMKTETRHFGTISIALILLGHGLTDECHDLITPLSWPNDIHFAHGPSIYHEVLPSARAYASYVHSLVHRKEAFHHGEFGLMGFQNANYWSNAANSPPGVNNLPHTDLHREISSLAGEFADHEPVKIWCSTNLDDTSPIFDARMLHQLCANVQKQNPRDSVMRNFAERAVESEIRVLLTKTLRNAGFVFQDSVVLQRHTDSCIVEVSTEADLVNIALSASRKVSSAHLDQFRSQGSVILRGILNCPVNKSSAIAAAAGLACRLLDSPGCKLMTDANGSHNEDVVEVGFSFTEQTLDVGNGALYLRDGDAWVSEKNINHPSLTKYSFEAASKESPDLAFLNPLHGARGETPTTVAQWSKGTIF